MAQTPETGHAASGRWTKFDVVWMLNLFGTAVGAGILFLPINAGMSGIWPLVVITLLVGPMTYFAHRGLARFVLSSSRADSDITAVVEEHFGLSAGKLITLLYFFAIYPILLIYAVGITNTVESFIVNQLQMAAPPRLLLSGVLVAALMAVILVGENFMLKFNEWLVYPLCGILFCLSLYLIPHWNTSSLGQMPDAGSFLGTLWLTLPVLVFAFNHSPAISSFALAQHRQYGDMAEQKASQTLRGTACILVLFVMAFVFSCVLSLSPAQLVEAKAQNIPVLSYLANQFDNPFISWFGPLIAFLAIGSSFFGHYLGAREGLHGILIQMSSNPEATATSRSVRTGIALFFFVTLWLAGWLNPGILDIIESLSGPVIAMILFIMPMYAVHKIPAMSRYRGQWSNPSCWPPVAWPSLPCSTNCSDPARRIRKTTPDVRRSPCRWASFFVPPDCRGRCARMSLAAPLPHSRRTAHGVSMIRKKDEEERKRGTANFREQTCAVPSVMAGLHEHPGQERGAYGRSEAATPGLPKPAGQRAHRRAPHTKAVLP